MAEKKKLVSEITSMDVDFAQWYTDIVKKAEMADYSSVKGCIIMRPYAQALWENIQHTLDGMFKETGHENVAMPIFIPESLLQKEAELQEIVKLVGQDALSPADNLTLESAKMIREDFLQQNAFLENDQYSSFDRQARLLDLILRYKDLCDAAIERGADIWKLYAIAARAAIGRAKTVPAERYQDVYAQIEADMEQQIEEVAKEAEAE